MGHWSKYLYWNSWTIKKKPPKEILGQHIWQTKILGHGFINSATTYSNSNWKKKESILQQKWPRNNSIVEDNAYKSLAFAYIKEMDQPMSTYSIIDNEEEESRSATYPKGVMKMDDKKETTPTIIMCKRWNDGHQWGRTNHAMSYTNVKNRFLWREHLRRLILCSTSEAKSKDVIEIHNNWN